MREFHGAFDKAGRYRWQVMFTTPENNQDIDETNYNVKGSIAEALIKLINKAKKSIHICSFEMDLEEVADALIAAKRRGLEVVFITDDEYGIEADEEDGLNLFTKMEAAGIEIHDDARSGLMHDKIWLFDKFVLWTGSCNITVNGVFRNNNDVVVLYSEDAAAIYENEFDEMRAGEFGTTSTSTVDEQVIDIAGTEVRVFFGAEDDVIDHISPIVQASEKSVRFMAYSFTHDTLGDAVIDRFEQGKDVMGIFEHRGSETEYSELGRMYDLGMQVRQDGNSRTFHFKNFVLDEDTVMTGSFNYSESADKSNDENILLLGNETIAQLYMDEFDRRWEEGSDYEPDEDS
jgi:phosphatidylserine/phosphatidylglycerophosphate/cardiolipin synthase-like enzyme